MEPLTSNDTAHNVTRRIITKATELEKQQASEQGAQVSFLDENAAPGLSEDDFLLEDIDYDSDDPRSLGGPYYWDHPREEGHTSLLRKGRDNCRYIVFHVQRGVGFAMLVLQHFFGLHKSRFQWALDLAEEEQTRREQQAMGGSLQYS